MRTQLRNLTLSFVAVAALAALSAGCSTPPVVEEAVVELKDGDIAVPGDYKSWPKFLSAVQRPDAKQVREIYMNPVAKGGTPAAGFPNGTIFVMENWAVQTNADGTLKTGADGKLVKGDLLKVFVMAKNRGWAADYTPVELRNGNWIYSAWLPNGAKSSDSTLGCRACHAPLTSKDFVHRYDEHFGQKGG
ncbi:MAG: hypothetical protein RL030_2529 [Pseudomonadota bacterium]